MPKNLTDPVFTVKLEKGLADRKRLPLSHVISVLDELRQLITEIGKDLQRRKGIANPTGDFGLELLAGENGMAFRGGSVEANIVISERPATGFSPIKQIKGLLPVNRVHASFKVDFHCHSFVSY